MKFTILQKNQKTLSSQEQPRASPEAGPKTVVGSENTSKSPDVVRKWIPMLTTVMALLVLVSSGAVLNSANHVVEQIDVAMISVTNISVTCYPAVGFAVLQLCAGLFLWIHAGNAELTKFTLRCWIAVYLVLMALAIESSAFGLKIGLHRNALGFPFVYFSLANAFYLLMTVMTLLMMYRS